MKNKRGMKTFPMIHLYRIFILFFIAVCLSGWLPGQTTLCFAEANDAIKTYQKNRQEFVNRQKQVQNKFNRTVEGMAGKIEEAKKKIEEKNKQINESVVKARDLESLTDKFQNAQIAGSYFVLPLVSSSVLTGFKFFGCNWTQKILIIGLALCALNVGLFLLFNYKDMGQRNKKLVIISMVFFIISITSPLFASDLESREKVIKNLDQVGKVLSQSEYERFIAILESFESKPSKVISLPKLDSGDSHFSVYSKVVTNTPEYWYTLAALYTHEKTKGRTIEKIMTMIEKSNWNNSKQHQKIIFDCIGYLLQEQQTEKVSTAIEFLAPRIHSQASLLNLAGLLDKNGMQASAEKILAQVIRRASTVTELIELAEYFLKKNEPIKGQEALEKAVKKVRDTDQLILVLQAAIKMERDDLINMIIPKVKGKLEQRMRVVDLFINNGRMENATEVFSKMIKVENQNSKRRKEILLRLIDAALQRDMLPQATEATRLLFINLSLSGENNTAFAVSAGSKLDRARGIPDENRILLPQFYGLLNEEQEIYDEAEDAYINDVLQSLEKILESYGYTFPDNLNSFYLLGRIWVKDHRGDLLGELDKVYSIIEAQFLAKQEQAEKQELGSLEKELNSWQVKLEQLEKNYGRSVADLKKVRRKMITQLISTISSLLLFLVLLVGCIIISYQYCCKITICRTFGFFTKFVEITGWVKVLSIFGVVSGIVSVLFAQLLQLVQQNQENTRRIILEESRPKDLRLSN